MVPLGMGVGVAVVPQQHRLFAVVPATASVAMGFNGSAIYAANALGAGIGGLAMTLGGPATLAPTALAAALLAIGVAVVVRPERLPTTGQSTNR